MKVSVFPIYIVWARFREQFLSCNGAVNFCFLNSHNVRLAKIKEGQQFKFFLMLLMFMLINFSPPAKLFLFVPNEEDPVFFSFVR